MPGRLEIHRVSDEAYRFNLTDKNGKVVAVSPDFKHLGALKDGIKALRENAATGVVVDLRHKPHPS
ncbi:YegP family protein [Pseudarthrobacter sp. BIM B-2242]|nr:YegP family protein [Pseudarthrobacter sp. BIM B-2242]QOD02814.1 YegP family protein [Pseudarthrobacter sp. BIM B-2242]